MRSSVWCAKLEVTKHNILELCCNILHIQHCGNQHLVRRIRRTDSAICGAQSAQYILCRAHIAGVVPRCVHGAHTVCARCAHNSMFLGCSSNFSPIEWPPQNHIQGLNFCTLRPLLAYQEFLIFSLMLVTGPNFCTLQPLQARATLIQALWIWGPNNTLNDARCADGSCNSHIMYRARSGQSAQYCVCVCVCARVCVCVCVFGAQCAHRALCFTSNICNV